MASWSVYIVCCRDGSLYTGVSNDVRARVQRHNDGRGARYTRSRLPVKLVWRKKTKDKSTALKLEAATKKLSRLQKMSLLKGSGRIECHQEAIAQSGSKP